jgi:hypothetical protein
LHLFERHRLALIKQTLTLIDDLSQVERRTRLVQRGGGRNEIILCLHHVGGLDREQRLPNGHDIAGLDEQLEDPSGIRREDRRRAVLVDRDLAFGHALGLEHPLLHRLDRQRRPLRGGWIEHATLGLIRKFAWPDIGSSVRALGRQPDQRSGDSDENNAQQRCTPRNALERMFEHLQLQTGPRILRGKG